MASITTAGRSLAATAVLNQANTGFLRIYDGVVPADANAALNSGGTNNLLAELTLAATAFTVTNGVGTAGTITADSSANATGTASFFRVYGSNGTTVVFQGTVNTTGAELNLSSVNIVAGGNVSVSSLTYTQAGS